MSNVAKTSEKKAFAGEQFSELVHMGLTRRKAGELMWTTGPRLAVICFEWTRSAWQHVKEFEADEIVKHSASTVLEDREWAEDAEVIPGLVQCELSNFLDEVYEALTSSPPAEVQQVIKDFNSGKIGRFYDKPIALPAREFKDIIKILDGAKVILPLEAI